ncbi:MAG: leucine-rich repeat domain-containing protein [Mycoplasmoidaceae bacterium]|nr:leucine-rich repeat domain-containing protein [Mycoplasmoidaceae bacterium]
MLNEATNDNPESLEISRSEFDYEIHIGANVERIEDYFLEGCSKFNSNIRFADGGKLRSIGDSFLGDCVKFKSTSVDLPDGLLSIGSDFMYNCSLYGEGTEAKLTLDSSLVYVGESFMVNCNALFGIVVECNPNVIHNEQSVDTLAVYSLEGYGGISVEGAYKTQFQSKFPAFDDTETGLYRRYRN